MARADSGPAQLRFDSRIRPSKGAQIDRENVNHCIGARGTYYIDLDLGQLTKVRFRVQISPKNDSATPIAHPNRTGIRWFDYVFPSGLPYFDMTWSGRVALHFHATGGEEVTLHVAAEGPDGAEGALSVHFGKQMGGI